MKSLLKGFTFILFFLPAFLVADTAVHGGNSVPAAPSVDAKTMVVTSTTDTSGMNMARTAQFGLARLYEDTKFFSVKMSGYTFPGFSETDISRSFESLASRMASFAYIERERVAVFLFDSSRPKEFIVASEPLIASTRQISQDVIEEKIVTAFRHVMSDYREGHFQPLPGTQVDTEALKDEEDTERRQRSRESRKLFRELASIEEGPLYLGANLGMARFSAYAAAASTINVGAHLPAPTFYERFHLEAGVKLAQLRALATLELKYVVPHRGKICERHPGSVRGGANIGGWWHRATASTSRISVMEPYSADPDLES